jgi:hypothetical protein
VVPDIAGVYSLHAGVYYTKMAEGIAMGLAAALVLLLGVSFCVLPRFCKGGAPEHLQVCFRKRMLGTVRVAGGMQFVDISACDPVVRLTPASAQSDAL